MSNDSSKPSIAWNPWIGLIVALAALFGSQIIVGIVLSIYPLLQHMNSSQAANWLNNSVFAQFLFVLLAESLAVVVVLLFLKKREGAFKAIGLSKPKWLDPLLGVAGVLAYYLIYLVFISVAVHFDKSLNINQKQEIGFTNVHGGTQLVLTFISLVILPPIAEEIIFRGLTYSSLKKIMPIGLAVIVTSLLFAAGHLAEGGSSGPLYVAAIDTFALSLILILLREVTGRLWASMTLHALKNGIAFMALFVLHLT